MTSVLLDGRALADASSYRGIGTYVRNLVEGLDGLPDIDVSALVPPRARLPAHTRRITIRRWAPDRLASLEHDLRLPGDLRRVAADVFHSPALDPPRRSRGPWVQTLHDVIPLVVDDPALVAERKRWLRYRPRFQRAAAVIAISRSCADQAIEVLGLDPTKVHVVYHGVESRFRPAAQPAPADPPYLLYVGEFDPRKGYREAFEVVSRLAELGHPHRLKVAGRLAPWVRPRVEELRGRSTRPDRIDLLGYVDHNGALPELYQQASVMIVTSRHEGFGLPAAEAMASGTPVVAFDNTSIAEIVADGGVLVPDGDIATFASSVASVVQSPERWQELSQRAQRRARAFDWRECVRRHAEIYRAVAAGG